MRARIFEIVSDTDHLSENEIIVALAHRTITRYAYVLHDKDVYTEQDEKKNKEHKAGTEKKSHWHVEIELKNNATEPLVIAKWFGVPENFVEIKKGKNAFLECVEYITHEDEKQQMLGKHRYDDSEIKSNFAFRTELAKLQKRKARLGLGASEKDMIRHSVLFEGVTLRQLCEDNPLAYIKDSAQLRSYRLEYIEKYAPLPKTRINYYVCGQGGVGKGLICRAIARSLFPNLENDEDIFFEVGAKGVPFEGYDGQPVIIWNDRRAYDLLQELNGRGNVFNVFDTHPIRAKQNVKYSSVTLCNSVNIVNSVQSYKEFLDGLAGEYAEKNGQKQKAEDKSQSYRRFPFLIPLHEEDFDLLMNKGFYEGTREYEQYIQYKNIRGNMQRIAELCGRNEERRRQLESKAVALVTAKHNEVVDKVEKQNHTIEEIDAYEKLLGTIDGVVVNEISAADDDDGPPTVQPTLDLG